MRALLSTQEAADLCGVPIHQVRRLFTLGDIPEPDRFAGKRAIPATMIPQIIDALRARGWIPMPNEVAHA